MLDTLEISLVYFKSGMCINQLVQKEQVPFGTCQPPTRRPRRAFRASLYFDSQRCFDWYQNTVMVARKGDGINESS